jgi:hypothetical protein
VRVRSAAEKLAGAEEEEVEEEAPPEGSSGSDMPTKEA